MLSKIALFALAAIMLVAPVSAATPSAITSFNEAFAKTNDYVVTVHAHEVKGSQTQDRVYQYWFRKPHQAKTQVISGPGAGGGGVWNGGNTVSGHQGGILSFIHLNVGLHDGRATSLRGYTIPDGLLQNQVAKYTELKGQLTQRSGPEIGGQPTVQVELKLADSTADPGITRAIIYFSKTTHFPLEQVRYGGDRILSLETWTDLHTNVGLKDSDF